MQTNEEAPQKGMVPMQVFEGNLYDAEPKSESKDAEPEQTPESTETTPAETETEPEAEPVEESTEPAAEESETEQEGEEQQEETEPEQEPAAEVPETKAASEPEPDPAMVRHAQFGAQVEQLLNEDPDVRRAYLMSLKRRGVQLPAHVLQEIETPTTPAQPAAPVKTYEEIKKEAQALIMRGEELAANELIADWRIEQAIQKHVEPFKKEHAALKQAEQQRAKAAQEAEEDRALRSECLELAKKYPGLAEPDPKQPWGVKWKDQEFYKGLLEISRGVNHTQALPILADVVLARQGKLSMVQTTAKAAPKPAVKPPLKPAPRPGVRTEPKEERGMVRVPISVVER